jgi:type I restriction enzyme S subunit
MALMDTIDRSKVPELRFRSFSGEWLRDRIDWFLERVARPVDVEPGTVYREIGIRSHGKGIFYKVADSGETLGEKRVFWVEPDAFVVNIVFAWEQAIGLTSQDDVGLIASHRFPMYVGRNGRADPRFVRDFFLKPRGKYLLELASPGGAGRNKTLGQANFAELIVTWPAPPEQEKIADFIAVIDRRIRLLERRRDALQAYKKSTIERIFSRELRFKRPDGSEFADWQQRKLGEILKVRYGKDHSALDDGVVPVYGTGDNVIRSVNKAIHNGPSVLIGRKGTIDRPRFVSGAFWTVDTMFYTDFAPGIIPYFAFILVQRVNWAKYSEATGVPSLSAAAINSRDVMLPPDSEEQRLISDCISAVEKKIKIVFRQLELTSTFKRSMLQKLFV